jgi:hypothetical protein
MYHTVKPMDFGHLMFYELLVVAFLLLLILLTKLREAPPLSLGFKYKMAYPCKDTPDMRDPDFDNVILPGITKMAADLVQAKADKATAEQALADSAVAHSDTDAQLTQAAADLTQAQADLQTEKDAHSKDVADYEAQIGELKTALAAAQPAA